MVFRECNKEVQLKNYADHVRENTCAVNLQHIDQYEFVQGKLLMYLCVRE